MDREKYLFSPSHQALEKKAHGYHRKVRCHSELEWKSLDLRLYNGIHLCTVGFSAFLALWHTILAGFIGSWKEILVFTGKRKLATRNE
jgi:hypothetical protein